AFSTGHSENPGGGPAPRRLPGAAGGRDRALRLSPLRPGGQARGDGFCGPPRGAGPPDLDEIPGGPRPPRRPPRPLHAPGAEAPPELYAGQASRFELKPWTRKAGAGGGTGAFFRGRLFEKAAVHTSAATATFSPEMAATIPGTQNDATYVSASISLIVHPRS